MLVSPRSFRLLLLLAVVVALAANFVDVSFPGALPLAFAHRSTELLSGGIGLKVAFALTGVTSLVTSVIGTIGLALFRRWSRPLTVISVMFQAFSYLLTAYFVTSGAKFALCMLANALTGVIIALAYCSPLAERFDSRPLEANAPPASV